MMADIIRIRIPERIIEGKRLGRHIHIDPRSKAYPAELAVGIVSVIHKSQGLPLDQDLPKPLGSCTANALCGAVNTAPNLKAGARTLAEPDALSLYNAESILQGTGPVPPNDPGGSGTEVCQAAKNAGMITAYQHAAGIDQALAALVIRPVITGINWMTSFDSPDQNGLVSIAKGATVRGGHEIFANEIDAVNELVWFWNSWGLGYGKGGRFCMRFSTWDTLLQQGGDVTVPVAG
jgi:hypothetical protein